MLKFYALCAAGICGSLFIGYCIYFDKKRRSDPDYKKKVIARRKKEAALAKRQRNGPGIKIAKPDIDLNDPSALEEFLMTEMTLANQELMQGNVPDCISHLVNFVVYSGNPKNALTSLQHTLPPTIFELLIQVYASLEKKVRYKC